jgi:DNA-binding NarL/FixJ family response regulator
MAESIRILLIDDQQLMHEGLCILLELEPDLKGDGGEAGNGPVALRAQELGLI